ncbi:MAG: hypothetical protein K9K35_10470 [Rhodoferax sp.]|nr:hypothetical protein [Rhodoferax sp.]
MPYCLERLQDGSYLLLNRQYKPLGVMSKEWVDYETQPSRMRFKRALSAKQIAALSWCASTDPARIYLYNDGCVPTATDSAWSAYSARLNRLAKYRIEG